MTNSEPNHGDTVPRVSLPAAAQRWLDRALPRDLHLPSSIRIEQEGTMEIRGRWTPFEASGVYRAPPLSFNWRARFRMLPGVWIIAEDGHLNGQAWGSAQLWGIVSMGKRTGQEVLTSQLLRNLGELPWLPSFVLADPSLTWTDAGENAFEVRASTGDREAEVRFETNDQDDVIRASSPSRPFDVPGGYAEAPWHYDFRDHREYDGVRMPTAAVGTFEKSDGPWEYFRGRITSITTGATPSFRL